MERATFYKPIVKTRMLTSNVLVLLLLVEFVYTTPQSSRFEAAFQGECRKSSPCQQMCFDLHDGTFECACHQGFHLDLNGYSCSLESTKASFLNQNPSDSHQARFSSSSSSSSSSGPVLRLDSSRSQHVNKTSPPPSPSSSTGVLYSCADIECEAGGVCLDDDHNADNHVRCHCPLGRGGQFCEKVVEVHHPHFQRTSYLALPTLRNSYRSMRLTMEFKPEKFDGVLLYSGQEPTLEGDFISIVLNQGFLEFRFDCGMGEGLIRSDVPVLLNAWNTLTIFRDGRNAWLQLNHGQQIYGHSRGLFTRITFRLETFLGGSPNISQITQRVHTNQGLSGCIRMLQINERTYNFETDTIDGVDIEQCNTDACDGVVCLNDGNCAVNDAHDAFCICPLAHTGQFCETETRFLIPSFNGSSYFQFFGLGAYGSDMFTEIRLYIKPISPDGLFLYNGARMDGQGDFLSLNLVDGYVEFRFDLGSGAAVIRSAQPVSLHQWHTIFASRTGLEGVLKVDNQESVYGLALGAFTQLSSPLNLYLGGVARLTDLHRNAQATHMFRGCLQRVSINGQAVSFQQDVLAGANVDNCEHACNASPCRNNGACLPIGDHFQCHCSPDFIGARCEKGTADSIIHPMFYGNSFLQYTNSDIVARLAGLRTTIILQLRAFSSNGLILWFGETSSGLSGDHLSLGLNNGHLTVAIDLGAGTSHMLLNATRIDDGRWHNIELNRFARQFELSIDARTITRRLVPGDKTRLDAKGSLYLGGMEDTVLSTNALFESGFIGCITNVTLGSEHFNLQMLTHSERAINVRSCI